MNIYLNKRCENVNQQHICCQKYISTINVIWLIALCKKKGMHISTVVHKQSIKGCVTVEHEKLRKVMLTFRNNNNNNNYFLTT